MCANEGIKLNLQMQYSVNSFLAYDVFCNFAVNLCKQVEPRSGPTKCDVLKKLILKNQQATYYM